MRAIILNKFFSHVTENEDQAAVIWAKEKQHRMAHCSAEICQE